jgi:hypothetical protein
MFAWFSDLTHYFPKRLRITGRYNRRESLFSVRWQWSSYKQYNLLTYLLHGAESLLRSWPVFAASQEIPRIFIEPEGSLPYSQVPATRPYPEPTPPSPHDPLQLPKDPSKYYPPIYVWVSLNKQYN